MVSAECLAANVVAATLRSDVQPACQLNALQSRGFLLAFFYKLALIDSPVAGDSP